MDGMDDVAHILMLVTVGKSHGIQIHILFLGYFNMFVRKFDANM